MMELVLDVQEQQQEVQADEQVVELSIEVLGQIGGGIHNVTL